MQPSLKALVLRGSAWMIVGHGAGQVIRLVKSLILTRLLFPEAFGMMALVGVVMYGLQMLSDVGLVQSVLRDKRGDEPDFLNTVWTMQAVRGALLFGASCLIAWPMAAFYAQPDLALLIPVTGLTVLCSGFNSHALYTCRRRMEFGRLVTLELATEVVAFGATVLWAYLYPTVWSLVGGALVSSLLALVGSHVFFRGLPHRFRWEAESVRALAGFGKWIFLSSAVTFVAQQSDLLLLGRYLEMSQLGVYSIAITLSSAVYALVIRVNHSVLYPAYGRIVQNEAHRLGHTYHRARLGVDALLIFPIGVLMLIGSRVVDLLYDGRYHEAGWIFQVLCVRLLMAAALSNSEACLVALGHPKYALMQNVGRAAWILAGIPIGWSLGGVKGVVVAVALCELPVMAVLWVGLIRHRMFSLWSELRSVLFAAGGALLGFGLLALLR